jgi:hypothetical protein
VQGQARHQRRDIERQRQHDDPKDLEFTIVEARSRTGTARWNGLAALLLRDGQPPLSKDECRDLLRRFLAAHPEHAQGMECALAENVTDDELAARYSCNRKTIHNRRQRAKLSLRSFYHSHA